MDFHIFTLSLTFHHTTIWKIHIGWMYQWTYSTTLLWIKLWLSTLSITLWCLIYIITLDVWGIKNPNINPWRDIKGSSLWDCKVVPSSIGGVISSIFGSHYLQLLYLLGDLLGIHLFEKKLLFFTFIPFEILFIVFI